jgi:hypothetical protein
MTARLAFGKGYSEASCLDNWGLTYVSCGVPASPNHLGTLGSFRFRSAHRTRIIPVIITSTIPRYCDKRPLDTSSLSDDARLGEVDVVLRGAQVHLTHEGGESHACPLGSRNRCRPAQIRLRPHTLRGQFSGIMLRELLMTLRRVQERPQW